MKLFSEKNIREIQYGYKAKEYSVEEIAGEIINLSKKYRKFNVWNDFNENVFLEDARKSQKLIECEQLRRLSGIPFGVKDIINTYQYTTEMGSRVWKGFCAGNDARIVAQMKWEGGIVAGKTVTAEFAVHDLNATQNPYDTTRTPGTSSSGSAVAVALGMVPVALATQTAGSIIQPASFCGIFGFKPSFGVIPRVGIWKTADSLDTVGFFTSNIKNIRMVFDSVSVSGPDYPFSYRAYRDENRQKKGKRPWKVAFIKTYAWNNAETYVKNSIQKWIMDLGQDPDIYIEEIEIDHIIKDAHNIHKIIYNKSLSYYFEKEYLDKENISDVMKEMITEGNSTDVKDYLEALVCQEQMIEKMDQFMQGYDAIISMSAASVAVKRGEVEKDDPDLIWTLLHLPTVNVPVFWEEQNKMPFGVQVSARKYNDYLLMDFLEDLAEKDVIPQNVQQMNYKELDL